MLLAGKLKKKHFSRTLSERLTDWLRKLLPLSIPAQCLLKGFTYDTNPFLIFDNPRSNSQNPMYPNCAEELNHKNRLQARLGISLKSISS